MSTQLTVSIPHLTKEYEVELPLSTTCRRLYEALMSKLPSSSDNGPVVYELFSKRTDKKIYPDYKDHTLAEIGIPAGDTIILKKDMDPGSRA
jgi:hypothetical protein